MSCITAPQILFKQPTEKRKFTLSFRNLLPTGASISLIKTINSQMIGGDLSDLILSASGIESTGTISMWIEGGSNNRYRIEALVETSGGEILEGDGILKVTDT